MSLTPPLLFAIQSAFEVGSVAVGLASAAGQASAQSDINAQTEKNVREAQRANYDQLALMNKQAKASSEQSIFDNDQEALKNTETARAAAGEAGVSGLSVDSLLRDMWGKQARFTDNVNVNLENQTQQVQFEKGNVTRTAQSQLNSMPVPQKPNYIGGALQAGSGLFGAYKDHLKVK